MVISVVEKKFSRKPLVANAGVVKTVLVMLFSHLSIGLLCVNVMFDLFVLGAPAYLVKWFASTSLFRNYMTVLIDWTTPIVFNLPFCWSGTTIYVEDPSKLAKSKSDNSLMLSNHGSRIDWMVGMYVGYSKNVCEAFSKVRRSRVGFVCEGIIQYMPLIGWYRRLVCEDVFVMRSFKQDAQVIRDNCNTFHAVGTKRMLFSSPEGVVVDFGERDRKYIMDCQKFCKDLGYKPFEYVLTPRYKGITCLVEQVKHGGSIFSVCMAFVRDGKLLNIQMTSMDREIPDMYSLLQGIGGSPIDIYINMEELFFSEDDDIKSIIMKDYVRKDKLLKEWHMELQGCGPENFQKKFTVCETNNWMVQFSQVMHTVLMVVLAKHFDFLLHLLFFCTSLVLIIAIVHTLGWVLNATSMESVPFETGIKAVVMLVFGSKHKSSEDNKKRV